MNSGANVKMAGALALLLLTTVCKIVSETAPGYDAAGSKAAKSCDEIRYLLGLAGKFRQEAQQNAKIADQMQTVATALKLAANMHQQPIRRAAFTALAITQAKSAKDAAMEAENANSKLLAAATAVTARAHRTIVMRKLRITSLSPGTGTAAINTEGTTKGHPAESTITTTNQAALTFLESSDNCSIDDLSKDGTIVWQDINPRSIYKLKLVEDNAIMQAVITLKAATKTNPTSGAAAITGKPGYVSSDGSSGTDNYLGALGSVPKYNDELTETDISADSTKLGECRKPADAHWYLLTKTAVADVLCQALKTKKLEATSVLSTAWSTLTSDPSMALLIELLTEKSQDQRKTDTEAVTKLLKAAFGESEKEYATNFVKFVTEKEHSFQIGDDKITGKLTDLASGDKEEKLMAYLMGKTNQQCQIRQETKPEEGDKRGAADKTEENKDGDNKAPATNCSSHGTQDAFMKGQNCKWKNGACKDNSILVNKKLAMMDACFVSLEVFKGFWFNFVKLMKCMTFDIL
uniref:Variant surface glycoprotein 1125.4087 n=1 Tax=Trypanosoma brucei TaxID=5691 RepID=A0A1J0R9V4_9TRYP|nr:variant surface glycoprotein 1125.4087 [Trypanosoma brucei]